MSQKSQTASASTIPKVEESQTATQPEINKSLAATANPSKQIVRPRSMFDDQVSVSPLIGLGQPTEKDMFHLSRSSFDEELFQRAPRPLEAQARPETATEKGLKFLEQQKYREATTAFQTALRKVPKDPDLLFLTGFALAHCDSPSVAGSYLDRCLQQKADHLQALSLRGLLSLKSRRWKQADEDLTRALELGWPPRELLPRRSAARYSLRKFVEAEADATAAIEGGEETGEALSIRCLCRCALERRAEAEADYAACETLKVASERLKQCQQALHAIPAEPPAKPTSDAK